MESNQPHESDPARALSFLLRTARELLGDATGPLAPWEARLRNLEAAEREALRVAVAGTVKSGKSTLVNALIGRDLLKRGAGIVTSLVTRVRPGPDLRARLLLKGWTEVNREATDAALFLDAGEDGRGVDLRSEADRGSLGRALASLGEGALGEGGFFDKNVALLRAYLDGYERVRSLVGERPAELELRGNDFGRHREFAGQDALAAYVDDLILEIPGLPFGQAWELGDCQGYDSPNPRHMEKVQEYLLGAQLVIYVVSSRVGLREADLRFLRDIKALGLLEVTRFVLNADLGEHGSAEDLEAVRRRVEQELRTFDPGLSIRPFSALRALLESLRASGASRGRKEELLLELWSQAGVGDGEFQAFRAFLGDELGARRRSGLDRARNSVLRGARVALRARVEAAVAVAGR
ncbi:MAG: dynamin family protein, partial [Deferrisomatales bacterium]